MTNDDNKQIVRKFFIHSCKGEIDDALAMMGDDATCWILTERPEGLRVDKEKLRAMENSFFSVLKRIPRLELGRMTAEDDRVTLEMSLRDGLTRNGVPYNNDYFMLIRLDGEGRIMEMREYPNPAMVAPIAPELLAAG